MAEASVSSSDPIVQTSEWGSAACFIPRDGITLPADKVPAGQQKPPAGYIQWMDEEGAAAWFSLGLSMCNPLVLDQVAKLDWVSQYLHVIGIWKCISFGYLCLNLPAGSDPSYRAMWKKWFAGHPWQSDPADPLSARPEEFSPEKDSVWIRPEVNVSNQSTDPSIEWPATSPGGHAYANVHGPADVRTAEFNFGILRVRSLRRLAKMRLADDKMTYSFIGASYVNWLGVFQFFGEIFDPRGLTAVDDDDERVASTMQAIVDAATLHPEHAKNNRILFDQGELNRFIGSFGETNECFELVDQISHSDPTKPPRDQQTSRRVSCAGTASIPPSWHGWTYFPPAVAGGVGVRSTMRLSCTAYDTIDPARELLQSLAGVSASTIITRSREFAADQLGQNFLANQSADQTFSLYASAYARAYVEMHRPDPKINAIASALMSATAATGNVYAAVAGVIVGGSIMLGNAIVRHTATSPRDELGRWKPSIDQSLISGGFGDHPDSHVPLPVGFVRRGVRCQPPPKDVKLAPVIKTPESATQALKRGIVQIRAGLTIDESSRLTAAQVNRIFAVPAISARDEYTKIQQEIAKGEEQHSLAVWSQNHRGAVIAGSALTAAVLVGGGYYWYATRNRK